MHGKFEMLTGFWYVEIGDKISIKNGSKNRIKKSKGPLQIFKSLTNAWRIQSISQENSLESVKSFYCQMEEPFQLQKKCFFMDKRFNTTNKFPICDSLGPFVEHDRQSMQLICEPNFGPSYLISLATSFCIQPRYFGTPQI